MDTRVLRSSIQQSRAKPSSSPFPLLGLYAAAKQVGSVELNQVGNGVDHLYASKTIFEVHERRGCVKAN